MPTLETAPTKTPAIFLEQKRIIRAPRASVYQAWTNPEIIKQWFGPAGMYCPNAAVDLRVGGAYRINVHPTAETKAKAETPGSMTSEAVATGAYTKIVPNELLQFTWHPSWNPDEKSIVTVSLKDVEGGTEITLRHENFLSEGSRDGHNQGWTGCVDRLTTELEK